MRWLIPQKVSLKGENVFYVECGDKSERRGAGRTVRWRREVS
jgi:hypothetical protein